MSQWEEKNLDQLIEWGEEELDDAVGVVDAMREPELPIYPKELDAALEATIRRKC